MREQSLKFLARVKIKTCTISSLITRTTAWHWTTGRATLAQGTRLIVLDLGKGGTYWQQQAKADKKKELLF